MSVNITERRELLPQPIYDLSTDAEFEAMIRKLPGRVQTLVRPRIREIEEIRLQAFAPVQVLYRHAHIVYPVVLDLDDLADMDSVGQWRSDGRLGLEKTLHRFGRRATMNQTSLVTIRVAKALVGLAEPLREWLAKAEDGLVIMGAPGMGKTALLRDALRILSERLGGRLFVNDSSNEILGDGLEPHPITGLLSRVPIGDPSMQFEALNQTVKNFQPRWMCVDEISAAQDAVAIAYARSRGVRAVMTWHGSDLAEIYHENNVRALWPLIQRDEQGITGPTVARLGILIKGRGHYLIFENLEEAFAKVAAGEAPSAIEVIVGQADRWQHREAVA